MRRFLVIALLFAISASAPAVPLDEHLPKQGKNPAEYVLTKLAAHRIVILGESHWQRADAELVASLVPQLRARGIALAMETLQSDTQSDIDRLISAKEWDPALANRILLAAHWPYVQYRDILQQAWKANRNEGAPMKILALSPPDDWREKGIRYDAFMADAVASYATDDDHRVLVYCGMHHAFTRYQQIERLIDGRVDEFMDRMGNRLWRKAGEKVFLISLHQPHACGGWGSRIPGCARHSAARSTAAPSAPAANPSGSTSSDHPSR